MSRLKPNLMTNEIFLFYILIELDNFFLCNESTNIIIRAFYGINLPFIQVFLFLFFLSFR